MDTVKLLRFGSLVTITCGVFWAMGAVLLLGNSISIAQVILLAASILQVFAILGLYGAQIKRMGILGMVGFLLVTSGSVISLVSLAGNLARFTGANDYLSWFMLVSTLPLIRLSVLSAAIGFLLFGIETYRAGMLPRWAGGLMSFGGFLILLVGFGAVIILLPAGLILAAASQIWLGYAVWIEETERIERLRPI